MILSLKLYSKNASCKVLLEFNQLLEKVQLKLGTFSTEKYNL